ncbi:MAG: hypothetical protein C4293_03555 [Nitrospiraceae bacterium]
MSTGKAVQLFGIQTGDTIVKINNHSIQSAGDAWWAYQELAAASQSEVRLSIRRGESLMTKTYRIR